MGSWSVTPTIVSETCGGVTVDEATIAMAAAIVDIYTNRTESASGDIKARDLHWITQAICWQAAWLPGQPGFLERSIAAEIKQDGIEIDHGKTTNMWREWADSLAPLAARSIKNLSWKSTRPVRPGVASVYGAPESFLSEGGEW